MLLGVKKIEYCWLMLVAVGGRWTLLGVAGCVGCWMSCLPSGCSSGRVGQHLQQQFFCLFFLRFQSELLWLFHQIVAIVA